MAKYIFKEDYWATTRVEKRKEVGDYTENIDYITLKYKFKKGDVFEGEKIVAGVGVRTGSPAIYAVKITTPEALQVDGTKWNGQAIFEVLESEDVLKEQDLTTDASGETFLQKHQNHLLIAGALVLGYFAYKKLNK